MANLDYGNIKTDEMLKSLERRLKKEYKQAAEETEKKLRKYMDGFQKRDAEMLKLVESGKMTKADYKQWRVGQIATGKRWKELRDKLATDMTATNEIAVGIINGKMPDVYALNINYGTFEVEKASMIDTSFTLYNREAVNKIVKEDKHLLPKASVAKGKDIGYNKRQFQSHMIQGLLQGESIPNIAKRLPRAVGETNLNGAIRRARTMTTGAENGGRLDAYKRAQDLGIEGQMEWNATIDGRTRHTHALMDGERVNIGETFSNGLEYAGDPSGEPEEVYNCFIPETKIASDSEIIRSYKSYYEGKIVSIKTASGVEFSCTPNHPIFTPSGWVAAELLNNGDDLLVTIGSNKRFTRRYPNINHTFTSIKAIHDFPDIVSCKRTGALSVNFHGDIPTSDVEIVTHKRLLRNIWYSRIRDCFDKFIFKFTDKSFVSKCSLVKHFRSVFTASFGFISRLCKPFSFFGRSISHSDIHRLRTISNRDIILCKYSINGRTADFVLDGELLYRLPRKIFVDKIVSVDVSDFVGHIYNLQTQNGYYFVNSIIPQTKSKCNGIFAIAKNCRCRTQFVLKGFEEDKSDLTQRYSDIGDMRYDEWQEEHRRKYEEQQRRKALRNG